MPGANPGRAANLKGCNDLHNPSPKMQPLRAHRLKENDNLPHLRLWRLNAKYGDYEERMSQRLIIADKQSDYDALCKKWQCSYDSIIADDTADIDTALKKWISLSRQPLLISWPRLGIESA